MTLDEIVRALTVNGSRTADHCVRSVRSNTVSPTFPPFGTMTVREARVLYEHRRTTMTAANIAFDGLDSLLGDLSRRGEQEQLRMAGFSGKHESFVAVIDTHGSVLGCIRVGKGGDPP